MNLVCLECNRCLGCEGCTNEPGCYVDQLCPACTPANGRCLDCAQMRAEDRADWMTRYTIEKRGALLMKINLTYKEANLLMAILWEIGSERSAVIGSFEPLWRVTDVGADVCKSVMDKLEDANEEVNRKGGKDRDLSGAPKGTLQDAKWSK